MPQQKTVTPCQIVERAGGRGRGRGPREGGTIQISAKATCHHASQATRSVTAARVAARKLLSSFFLPFPSLSPFRLPRDQRYHTPIITCLRSRRARSPSGNCEVYKSPVTQKCRIERAKRLQLYISARFMENTAPQKHDSESDHSANASERHEDDSETSITSDYFLHPSIHPSFFPRFLYMERKRGVFILHRERASERPKDRPGERARDRLGDPRDRRRPTHSTEADDRPTDRRPTRGYFGFCNVGPKGRVEPQQK